jgi:uncharacterized membrane protein YoaK (UPF0700 family)
MSAISTRHPLARALLVLTFTTGVVDAASFLGLGHVFTANMTGNIVLLGFGIAGSAGLPVVAPLVSLGAFFTGSAIGGALSRSIGAHRSAHMARSLLIEVALITLATLVAMVFQITPNHFSGDLVIALLALSMGVRNATVRKLGIADLTTTVLTMTLTGLAADSPIAGGSGEGTSRRTAAVIAMLLGAIAGALLLKVDLALALAGAAVLALLTWLVFLPAAIAADREDRQV